MFVSYFIKPNLFKGWCAICDQPIAAEAGWVQKDRETERWVTLCDGCVREHGRFVPDEVYSKNLATSQVDRRGTCTKCGQTVGLVKSAKTGKWYLCETMPSQGECRATRLCPWAPHDCEEI